MTDDYSNRMVMQSMRLAAWERAKGELRSIGILTYDFLPEYEGDTYQALLAEFIRLVEAGGLINGE